MHGGGGNGGGVSRVKGTKIVHVLYIVHVGIHWWEVSFKDGYELMITE